MTIYAMTYFSDWKQMDFEDMEDAVMLMKRRTMGRVVDSYFDRHGNYITQIMYVTEDGEYDSVFLKDTEPDNTEAIA